METDRGVREEVKISLLYLHVVGITEGKEVGNTSTLDGFDRDAERFIKSYLEHPPGIGHELNVCSCGNGDAGRTRRIFSAFKVNYVAYSGNGWDIGAEQDFARTCDADFLVCMTSRTHFWRGGWLKRFVDAWQEKGEGLYGSTGSYEHNYTLPYPGTGCHPNPHIRTALYGLNPSLMRAYPYVINTRELGFLFESSERSITRWCMARGTPCWQVTWERIDPILTWREVANGFRSGDQSALIAFDRHSQMYAEASDSMKDELEKRADGYVK